MKPLANLRTRFERFCYKNRNKGIPNLMLYIVIGSAIVYLMSMFNGGTFLYDFLCFDKAAIFRGQVWRLFTWVLTYSPGSGLLILLFFYFFYNLGRYVEMSMGTFKFNLFYFSGVLLMDIFALAFCPTTEVIIGNVLVPAEYFTAVVYAQMGWYLHLSILLMFATTNPDNQFLIFFILPVKAWIMGILYLLMTAVSIFNLSYPYFFFPHNFFPLVGLLNFLLFAGKDVVNLFPFLRRRPRYKQSRPVVHFVKKAEEQKKSSAPYTHRCTICCRTDISNPELEFRYCSRCNGYYCYCQDHISNHTHVE